MREVVDGLGYVPKSCTWELTLACDLRCGHCGSRAGSPRANELERPRLLQIAQELADLGCRRITLSGGEPTLSKHWEAVGAAASGRGIAVNMITNAARADRELVRRARDAGLVSIAASLDGLEATHDRHRRSPGSFGRVMQLIDDCHAVGLPVGVITTLQKRNVRELEQMEVLLRGRIYVCVHRARQFAGIPRIEQASHRRFPHPRMPVHRPGCCRRCRSAAGGPERLRSRKDGVHDARGVRAS